MKIEGKKRDWGFVRYANQCTKLKKVKGSSKGQQGNINIAQEFNCSFTKLNCSKANCPFYSNTEGSAPN